MRTKPLRHKLTGLAAILCASLILSSCSRQESTDPLSQKEGQRTADVALPHGKDASRDSSLNKDSAPFAQSDGYVSNVPPQVTWATLRLRTVENKDILEPEIKGIDEDDDEIRYEYAWYKNAEFVGNSSTIADFKRGDKVRVEITPFDGTDYGEPVGISLEITNSTPRILEVKQISYDQERIVCQVKATDPDGDPLSFSLENAPPGMDMDPAKGTITWDIPTEFKGKASFTVAVSDELGGKAQKVVSLDIE